ncbi:polysaccharide biosynthesis C-terminal domain-containing protein [Maridesulfovibrio sp.]|uniref:polysaccharide biosynthesis C-terminal domain-containing protein n=1 Tax=Maridesulfovibrio sp. TaxID=2795000 RepID=UPI002A18D6BF|nr:polysaccharide biosynthesis C-terminal domain-containing protein [Maridesulfovibrio sp.]
MSNNLPTLYKIFWVFITKMGRGVGGLLLTWVLARKYGAYGSGLFFIPYTFAFLGALVSQLGLGNACMKFAPVLKKDDPANLSFLWTFTLLAVGAFSVAFMVLVYIAPEFFSELVFKNPDRTEYIMCAAPIIFFWALTCLIIYFRQSLGDVSGITVIENTVQPWAMLLLALSTFVIGIDVLDFLLSITVLFGVIFVYAFISTRSRYRLRFSLRLNSSLKVRDIAAYCLPLLVLAFAQNSLVWINTLILGGIGSVDDSAIFVSGMRVAMSITILLYTFNSVYVPHISSAYSRNDLKMIGELYRDITCSLSLFSFVILVLSVMYSDLIMAAFGSDYGAGRGCLVYLILGNVFNCYTGPVGYVLLMAGRSRLEAFNTVTALCVNGVLCLVLYRSMGVAGAGAAFFWSFVLVNTARYLQCRKILGLRWLNPMQARIMGIQAVFAIALVLAWNTGVNRELTAGAFLGLYALVNLKSIRVLAGSMMVNHEI